jgi:4'-phosphopantetheinyl transferase
LFFRCWTRKEAFIKASGEGLERALDRFEVSVGEKYDVRLRTLDDPAEADRWSLCAPTLTRQPYVAALAIERRFSGRAAAGLSERDSFQVEIVDADIASIG